MTTDASLIQLFPSAVRRSTDPGDRLIPLINVVFLLLIFFMVAGKIQQQDQLDITLPSQELAAELQSEPATLQMTREMKLFFKGVEISKASLTLALGSADVNLGKPMVLSIDRDVKARELDELLELLRIAQIDTNKILMQQPVTP